MTMTQAQAVYQVGSDRACDLCARRPGVNPLDIPGDWDEAYSVHLCSVCWDIVSTLAAKVLDARPCGQASEPE